MLPRERVLAILNRQKVDRIPVDLWFTGEVYQSLVDHTGASDEFELYDKLGLDRILWTPVHYAGPMRPAEKEGYVTSFWGGVMKPVQSGQAAYMEAVDYPLASYETVESLDDYPWWPDPAQFNYQAMVEPMKQHGDKYAFLGPWISIFEVYCGMRGLEQAMMDVALEPEFVHAVLDRIEAIQTEMVQRYMAVCDRKFDMSFISDDMGGQSSLLISIKTWQEFVGPRLTRWCKMFHDNGVKVFYHSDGAVEPLVPHLIEAGIDILNPIQHICPGMDMDGLKTKYGEQLVFHGGVDTQNVLPFGKPEDVVKETQDCLAKLGKGGGYICCSCHNTQAGTPVENILAMIETVQKEGHQYL